jgi:hypothetical protein
MSGELGHLAARQFGQNDLFAGAKNRKVQREEKCLG